MCIRDRFWDRGERYPNDVVFDVFKNFEHYTSTSGRSLFLEELAPGTTHRFHVVAKSSSSTSSFPAMTIVQSTGYSPSSLGSPTDLDGIVVSGDGLLLRWQKPTNAQVDHYEVWRGGELVEITNQTLFLDEDIAVGSSYSYQVYAVAANGSRSAPSNVWSIRVQNN